MSTLPPPPPPPIASAAPPQQPASGSSGCVKWLFIGCGVVIALCAAFIAVLVLVVFGAIKHSDVYKESLRRVQNDPRVVAALGSPVEAGIVVTGKVNFEDRAGVANINYAVHGPNGRAEVHVRASKEPDHPWEYSDITVRPRSGPPIDVLQP